MIGAGRFSVRPFTATGRDQGAHARRQASGLQRMRVAAAVYACSIALQCLLVAVGMANPVPSAVLCLSMFGVHSLFYIAISRGVTARLADPTLTRVQLLVAVLALCAAYHINADIRGLALMGVVQLLFFAAFVLTEAQCRQLSLVALLLVALTIVAGVATEPSTFDPTTELVNLFFATVILSTSGILAGQLCRLRNRFKRQRLELRSAIDRLDVVVKFDALTGLLNRRGVFDWLGSEVRSASSCGQAVCLVIVDIDDFKLFNERSGYEAGDQLLQSFSRNCGGLIRSCDRLARWGGDEFLLGIRVECMAEALVALDRVRDGLSQSSGWNALQTRKVTFAAGLAMVFDVADLDASLRLADERLVEAKRQGQGRTVPTTDPDAFRDSTA